MQGKDHRLQRRSVLTLTAVILLFTLAGVAGAAPVITEINATPNPAYVFDLITIGSDGIDAVSLNVAYEENAVDTKPTNKTWDCQSFVPSVSGNVTKILAWGSVGRILGGLQVYDYVNSNETGALLSEQVDAITDSSGTTVWWSDFTSFPVESGVSYWACFNEASAAGGGPMGIDGIDDGNTWRGGIGAGGVSENSAIDGFLDDTFYMPIKVYIDVYTDVKLFVKFPSGDYDSDYIAASEYVEGNPSVALANPCTETCTLQAKVYNETNGWSDEVQTILYLSDFSTASEGAHKTGIYINSSDYSVGLHNYTGFAAGSNGTLPGYILVDGAAIKTCNYDWNCLQEINPGTHTYGFYSVNGGQQYTGNFTTDANTNFINIYAPITYNIFKIWETDAQTSSVACDDIYSLTADGDVSTQQRLSTGWYISPDYLNWNNLNVVPQNCYSDLTLPANYAFMLPGRINPTEPAVFTYSGVDGIGGTMYAQHFLAGGITGTRNRNGFVNFYDLYATSTGTYNGYVARKTASADDGDYSPITAISTPNMNIDSALYGDANYNPGDFALGDNVTCEAKLHSGGYVIYDVNFLLITDQNTIYAQSSFQPYKIYNPYMPEEQPSGAFNIVWHNFADVDTGHTGVIHCAIQTTNELGYKSGWVFSEPRVMYSSNYTATGGMNIFVKYEDGTTSYMGHESPYSSDLNYIDIYNWHHDPYYWGYDTADNPLTLFEGDGVIAQTYDRNATRTAGKVFNINRGDAFNINLYLADQDTHDQAPVAFAAQMYEQSAFGDRVYCKTNFYDKDLDWSDITFSFWTGNEGSLADPLCTNNIGFAYNSNCNPTDAPCMSPGATDVIMSDCGSDNDCYAETYFSKRGCASLASGETVGYCAMYVNDNNDNTTLVQASAALTVPTYQLFGICEAYSLIGSEKDSVIFTNSETGFVECLVGLDNVSEPSDLNWSVIFEGRSLAIIETIHDDYMDQDYFKFRVDATEELEALARVKSSDGETWEGDGTVFIQHSVYGSKDAAVHIAVTFVGNRVGGVSGDYTEAEFNELYYWIDGFVKDIMTNPIGTVQARFFEVLVITLFIIIFVPLLLIMGALEAKKRSEGS